MSVRPGSFTVWRRFEMSEIGVHPTGALGDGGSGFGFLCIGEVDDGTVGEVCVCVCVCVCVWCIGGFTQKASFVLEPLSLYVSVCAVGECEMG